MRLFLILNVMLVLLGSCKGGRALPLSGEAVRDTVSYATGYTVTRFKEFVQLDVRNPWDTTRLLQRYLLVDRNRAELPEGMPQGSVVRVPINRVIVYASVHVSILEQLGVLERVIGVCEPRYMDSKAIKERLAAGTVADIGEATAPNVEKMMEAGAEVLLTSPFKDSGYGPAEKLGLPIVEGADYMEPHPLGRAEWIRFYGLLLGKEALADSIFRATCREYEELKKLAAGVEVRPVVLSEKRYGGQWFVPGGESYIATLYKDAGADYVFKGLAGSGSVPLAFEAVLDEAMHAEIWMLKYNAAEDLTYEELAKEYAPYGNFDAFKNRRIFGCNTGKIMYYDEVPMHPHWLLKDYVWVFHPELLPGYQPRYFTNLARRAKISSR